MTGFIILLILIFLSVFLLVRCLVKKNKKKSLIYWLSTVIFSGLLFFYIGSVSRDAQHNNHNNFYVATEGAYYPWNYVEPNGDPAGFDVDIIKAVANKIGKNIVFKLVPWEGLMPGLESHQYDAIIAGISVTNKRKKSIDFSVPYAFTRAVFYGRPDMQKYNKDTLDELKKNLIGKTIGIQKGTTLQDYIDATFKGVNVKLYPTQSDLYRDVVDGRVDIAFSEFSAITHLLQEKKVIVVGPEISSKYNSVLGQGIGIGVAKGNDKLLAEINNAIHQLRVDGTLKKLSIKYFGFDISD